MFVQLFLGNIRHYDSIRLTFVDHKPKLLHVRELRCNEVHQAGDGFRIRIRCAGNIAARMFQVSDNFGIQRISNRCEQNRRIFDILHNRLRGWCCNPQYEIIFVTGNLLRNRQVVRLVSLGILQVNGKILALNDSGILKCSQEPFTRSVQGWMLYILGDGNFIGFGIAGSCTCRGIGSSCRCIPSVSSIFCVRCIVVSAARSHEH
ncbi:hypothetical protein D3C75_691230 [compost metagenome]